jgi:hypothetical protein
VSRRSTSSTLAEDSHRQPDLLQKPSQPVGGQRPHSNREIRGPRENGLVIPATAGIQLLNRRSRGRFTSAWGERPCLPEEVGRGRPTYEELPYGGTTNTASAGASSPVEMGHHSRIPVARRCRRTPRSHRAKQTQLPAARVTVKLFAARRLSIVRLKTSLGKQTKFPRRCGEVFG